ncbi:hypothetical protein [Dietzia psychralcaliphila]|uniref:Uncharacterized protein n=1 Tax=Dietzia psychralcaliphila TaxID=139021 RepID=A0AAD0JTU0_9ACTN|nr:hypothetical protein [Dietzia psychralcaliphila]AWH96497.1 hypothetical protein A6048_14505 [Dietzia psychralcaliphila]PTM90346.1 hypothetical protein C8N39_10199 [Dietzia psychralcaliphila]
MAGQNLEHTGAAIVEEYYPKYATDEAPVYPLYATEIYAGSAIMLLAMSMLGLPITALAFYTDDMDVSLGLVVAAVVATVVVFVIGLAVCMIGFRKYGRKDAH